MSGHDREDPGPGPGTDDPEGSPSALRDAASAIAREAGALLMRGHGRRHVTELKQSPIDLVTEYDRRSEELILARLRERFPDHAVLAEESGDHRSAGTRVRWFVDPLDGTTNFAHNYPFFCVSIAAERDGVLAAAAVFDPTRDELFAAAAGEGATLNGEPISVSAIGRLEQALLVTGFPYTVRERPAPIVRLFEAFLVRAQGVRRDGSAALNLCYVAMGRFDGFWEAHLSPWDMAAGALIVREAGGAVTGWTGAPLDLFAKHIVASNGHVQDALREVIASHGEAILEGVRLR